MRATEEPAIGLNAAPHDPAPAVLAYRRHGVDRTLEAVEHVLAAPRTNGSARRRTAPGEGSERLRTALARAITALVALLLVLVASGCAGGSRSGTDQPGVPQRDVTTQEVSINESSEDNAAALRHHDVDDPQRWAQLLVGNRPYAPDGAGEDKMRQVLQRGGADPGEMENITSVLAP